jgi:uncharacterized membrane protein
LPVIPFLLLAIISNLAAGGGWLRRPRYIILWMLVAFAWLTKWRSIISYLQPPETWQATREAIAQIQTDGGVLTSAKIAPHVSGRSVIKLATIGSESIDFSSFDYVLLNVRDPGWRSTPEIVQHLINRLKKTPEFMLRYQKDEIYLFEKIAQ